MRDRNSWCFYPEAEEYWRPKIFKKEPTRKKLRRFYRWVAKNNHYVIMKKKAGFEIVSFTPHIIKKTKIFVRDCAGWVKGYPSFFSTRGIEAQEYRVLLNKKRRIVLEEKCREYCLQQVAIHRVPHISERNFFQQLGLITTKPKEVCHE